MHTQRIICEIAQTRMQLTTRDINHTMNTVLFAVDDSQHVDKSLQIAVSLALQHECQVMVLYATEEKVISKVM
ncbi:MAG: hypothetical protein ACI9UN_004465 [Granulosicoccus sp.]|jgi:hypothetical protein